MRSRYFSLFLSHNLPKHRGPLYALIATCSERQPLAFFFYSWAYASKWSPQWWQVCVDREYHAVRRLWQHQPHGLERTQAGHATRLMATASYLAVRDNLQKLCVHLLHTREVPCRLLVVWFKEQHGMACCPRLQLNVCTIYSWVQYQKKGNWLSRICIYKS